MTTALASNTTDNKIFNILIADDDPDIIEFVTYNLSREGYEVRSANDGATAIELAKIKVPDLIILDVMMPGMDGIEVCRELRSNHKFEDTVITFLTARSEDYSQIAGFDSGGDDYITKPIRPRVLVSRIKALLRRSPRNKEQQPDRVIRVHDLQIDRDKVMVFRGNESITLAKKEFELIYLLASKPGRVFTREEIFNHIWGSDVIVGDRTIDVHIRKLREKIGSEYIKTIKGIGYKFDF